MEELLRLYEDWRGCAPQSVEQEAIVRITGFGMPKGIP